MIGLECSVLRVAVPKQTELALFANGWREWHHLIKSRIGELDQQLHVGEIMHAREINGAACTLKIISGSSIGRPHAKPPQIKSVPAMLQQNAHIKVCGLV